MNNEEAIKILEECLGQGRFFDSMLKQAYDKAIKALKDERPQGEWIEKKVPVGYDYGDTNKRFKEADNDKVN